MVIFGNFWFKYLLADHLAIVHLARRTPLVLVPGCSHQGAIDQVKPGLRLHGLEHVADQSDDMVAVLILCMEI